MANYCVNKAVQANGDYEVHNLDVRCKFEPAVVNQVPLGSHASCASAVAQAQRTYPKANGCFYCSRACHTS